MKVHSSTHLTMKIVVGTTIRVEAVISINTGSGAQRLTFSETPSSDDVNSEGLPDAGLAVFKAAKRLVGRVSVELQSRGLKVTAEQIEYAFREDVESEDGVCRLTHAVLDFTSEIHRHYFTELSNGSNRQTAASSSHPSHS